MRHSRQARHHHAKGHAACSVSGRHLHLGRSCIMMTNMPFILFHSLLTDVSEVKEISTTVSEVIDS